MHTNVIILNTLFGISQERYYILIAGHNKSSTTLHRSMTSSTQALSLLCEMLACLLVQCPSKFLSPLRIHFKVMQKKCLLCSLPRKELWNCPCQRWGGGRCQGCTRWQAVGSYISGPIHPFALSCCISWEWCLICPNKEVCDEIYSLKLRFQFLFVFPVLDIRVAVRVFANGQYFKHQNAVRPNIAPGNLKKGERTTMIIGRWCDRVYSQDTTLRFVSLDFPFW